MNNINFFVLFIISVFISSVSQIILKKGALKKKETFLKEYLNFQVIVGYSLFFVSAMLTMFAYSHIKLSWGPILEAMGYIFITLLSRQFLKEHISKQKLLGLSLIIIGIVIFAVF